MSQFKPSLRNTAKFLVISLKKKQKLLDQTFQSLAKPGEGLSAGIRVPGGKDGVGRVLHSAEHRKSLGMQTGLRRCAAVAELPTSHSFFFSYLKLSCGSGADHPTGPGEKEFTEIQAQIIKPESQAR